MRVPRQRIIDASGKTLWEGDWDGAPYAKDKELRLNKVTYRIVSVINTGDLLTTRVALSAPPASGDKP
jgi:hypothetical protein